MGAYRDFWFNYYEARWAEPEDNWNSWSMEEDDEHIEEWEPEYEDYYPED